MLNGHSKNTKTCVSRQIIAKCMSKVLQKGSLLQYFQPPLSYYLSLRYLFRLFWSGHFSQVLLYCVTVCVAVLLAVFDHISALCANNPLPSFENTVKPVLSGQSKRTPKIGFQYQLSLNAGQNILHHAPS